MKYEDRVVVYIDILGFKKLIEETIESGKEVTHKVDFILEAYERIRQTWDLDVGVKEDRFGHEIYESQGKVITLFSDLVVISFLQEAESGIWYTLHEVRLMILELAYMGVFCRGMVTYGKLYHTDAVIFGPALVEAYIGETKAALYPRVILSPDIIEIAKVAKAKFNSAEEEEEYVKDLIRMDSDGMYYIDYILEVASFLDDPEAGYVEYLWLMHKNISQGLQTSRPDILVKFMWLKERYNEAVGRIHKNIERFRREGEFELAAMCEQLALL